MTHKSKHMSVLCAGRVYCDLIFSNVPRMPTMGTETFAGGLELHTGGGAFITAVTLTRLGFGASLLSTLPAAPFDKITESEITQNKVGIELCSRAEAGCDPQITVAITTEGDRAFLSRKSGPAFSSISAKQLAVFRHLHIGELRTLKERPELISLARSEGLTISLDCGWDDELMSNPVGLAELIANVDVFLPNEMEFNQLESMGVFQRSMPLTAIKCGENGARAVDGKVKIIAPTSAVQVIDATGAGDAFNGGFISKWLQNAPIKQCLDAGNACGAIAVQGHGGTQNLETLDHQHEQSIEVLG